MDLKLKDKVAIVTGTGSQIGFGRGIALMLTRSQAVEFPESVTRLGSLHWPAWQLGGNPVPSLPGAELPAIAPDLAIGVPVPIWIFAIVVVVAALILRRTAIGRQIYAVGNDKESAQKAGISTDRVLIFAYVACGFLAALGGFVSVAQLGNVNAGFGEYKEFDAIAAAVLGGTSLFGGTGNVFPGTVLGAVLLRMIPTGLVSTQVDLYVQPLVQAAIIFAAVLIDSLRNMQLAALRRRHIRVEEPG